MNEWAAAKTQDEKVAVLNKYRQADERRYQEAELEFRANYTAEAIYLRDEIGKKLPSVPQPSNMMEGVIFKGMSGGSWGTLGAADYLDRLALTLCPR